MKIIALAGVLFSSLLLGGCGWFLGTPIMVTDLAVGAETNPARPVIGSAVQPDRNDNSPVPSTHSRPEMIEDGNSSDTRTSSDSRSAADVADEAYHCRPPVGKDELDGYFENERISAAWRLTAGWFLLELVNKTDYPIHVMWEDALVARESHWERLVDPSRALPQDPTVVAPRTGVRLKAAPLSTLTRHDTRTGGYWRCEEDGPLGTTLYERQSKAKVRRLARKAVGHRFRVLLPLIIERERTDYLFTITVTAARQKTIHW